MNVALILAGGNGKRTEQDIPKQFINVYEKPIIIHTLEIFEKHPDIDMIVVSCLEGWQDILRAYARNSNISKLEKVVCGGNNGQESTKNGITALQGICNDDDIIIIHDAIRPMVTEEIISDCIVKCRQFGSGLSAVRCQETIMRSQNGVNSNEGIARSEIMRVQTPQAYRYGKALWAHREAEKRNITDTVYMNTLMLELGENLYFSMGSNKNIKITTLDDLDIFKALYKTKREEWYK